MNMKIVKKIPEHYVASDCLQLMIGYMDKLLLLNSDEVKYQGDMREVKVNTYMDDLRKKQFPYYNIPTHYENICFKKHFVTNQILDFEVPYLRISEEGIFSMRALKNGREGLVVYEELSSFTNTIEKILTRDEVEKYFDGKDEYVFIYNCNIVQKINLPSLNEILESFKAYVIDYIDNKGYETHDDAMIKSLINSFDYGNISSDFKFLSNIMMVKSVGVNIELSLIDISFINEDCYKLLLKKIPINLYTLEELKDVFKIISREPKVRLGINPDITREQVLSAKRMVKEYKKR